MSKIYKRDSLISDVQKEQEKRNIRKRNVVVNFRVSEQEKKIIENRIYISGLSKSDFFIQSCMFQKILVRGNIKSFDAIKNKLDFLQGYLEEKPNLEQAEPEVIESLRIILEILAKFYNK